MYALFFNCAYGPWKSNSVFVYLEIFIRVKHERVKVRKKVKNKKKRKVLAKKSIDEKSEKKEKPWVSAWTVSVSQSGTVKRRIETWNVTDRFLLDYKRCLHSTIDVHIFPHDFLHTKKSISKLSLQQQQKLLTITLSQTGKQKKTTQFKRKGKNS